MKKLFAVVFWLFLWQAVSVLVGQKLILVSPVQTALRLAELGITKEFWLAIAVSFIRIFSGFLLGVAAGTALAVCSKAWSFVYSLLSPLMSVIKATPVASFTLLVFLWLDSSALSTFVSFIMVLPVIYFAVYEGIGSADTKLLEMAKVFCVGKIKTARQIYLPAVAPFLVSAVSVALGFAWKSGIAAEIICISSGTIGNMLYDAKLLLASEDIFAWTAVVIIISKLMEVLSVKLIGRFEKAVTK